MTTLAAQLICFSKIVVHQHATFLGGLQIGPAARRQADLEASAAHLAGYRADRVVFADFAFLQFGHPDGSMPSDSRTRISSSLIT
jgi:hypothetical protein